MIAFFSDHGDLMGDHWIITRGRSCTGPGARADDLAGARRSERRRA